MYLIFRWHQFEVGVSDAEELPPEQPAPEPDPGRAAVAVLHPEGAAEPLLATVSSFYADQIAD